jgi:hypothetical protein
MTSVPRIDRAHEKQPITTITPEPVIARLHYPSLRLSEDTRAWLIAVCPDAGFIYWVCDQAEGPRTDWIAAHAIRRPGEQPSAPPQVPWRDAHPRIITLEQSRRPAPPRPGADLAL